MSSDRTGAAGNAAATADSGNGASAGGDSSAEDPDVADKAQQPDPWFGPGPKIAGGGWSAVDSADFDPADLDAANPDPANPDPANPDPANPDRAGAHRAGIHRANADSTAGGLENGAGGADAESARHAAAQAEWFLRTGRAGLLPDSMTVSWDGDDRRPDIEGHAEAAGAPPWASDAVAAAVSAPPPWETGPWPGPGETAPPTGPGGANGRPAGTNLDAARPARGQGAVPVSGRWSARTVLAAGLVPLVLPGLVLGVLGLRQAGSGPAVRKASWLAIGASVAWAVVIVFLASGSGGPAARCGGYPVAVRQVYAKAMTDLSSHASAATQVADFDVAAGRANASAAAAGQIRIRTALFAMADDMAQARADVVAHRGVPATLRQHLTQDGIAPTGSCAT
jgi:hypothetical protein